MHQPGPDVAPPRRARRDGTLAVIAFLVLAALAAVAPVASAISMMVITSCADSCAVGEMHLGQVVFAVGPAVVLVAAAVAALLARRRDRGLRWIPVAGIALAIALMWLGDTAIHAGVRTG